VARLTVRQLSDLEAAVSLTLYSHPFSSYCWKVLIALYENDTPFVYRMMEEPGAGEELKALWPFAKFPVLADDGRAVAETSIIIEHLDLHHPGANRMVPADPKAAMEARFMDRFFDLYVMNPMSKISTDPLRPEGDRDAYGVAEARKTLDAAYGWLETRLEGRTWAAGDDFGLADCSGAPALFYADWAHGIGADYPTVKAYRAKVLARPSVARAVDEARPYRGYYPLGAPDRD
jgi:glutathione S-transferase